MQMSKVSSSVVFCGAEPSGATCILDRLGGGSWLLFVEYSQKGINQGQKKMRAFSRISFFWCCGEALGCNNSVVPGCNYSVSV